MKEKKNFIKEAIKNPGSLRSKLKGKESKVKLSDGDNRARFTAMIAKLRNKKK